MAPQPIAPPPAPHARVYRPVSRPSQRLPERGVPIKANALTTGRKIAAGGQGTIVELPDNGSLVAKLLHQPIPGGLTAYRRLDGLREAFVGAEGLEFVWPTNPILTGDALVGYLMPRISDRFDVEVVGKRREAQLAYCIPKTGKFVPSPAPDAFQRLQLVRRVAVFLDLLHGRDFVYGDVSWANILYCLHPVPTVLVLDVDSIRPMGGMPLSGDPAPDSPNWIDPAATGAASASLFGFDRDRYKFSLLAYRVLLASSVSAPLESGVTVGSVPGLLDWQSRRVQVLFERAAGPFGGRPSMPEWREALGCGE
jgi:hypothetical protein